MKPDERTHLEEEFRFHIECLTDMLVDQGMSRADATREAERRFGPIGRYRKMCSADGQHPERRGKSQLLTSIRSDLRYALRMLARTPGFTAVAVATLALGIGANTAIFSVVNGVLMRPLGFAEPERLGVLRDMSPVLGIASSPTSSDTFHDWREQARGFSDLAAWFYTSVTLEDPVESVELTGTLVTGSFFPTLGMEPHLGRLLRVEDEAAVGQRGTVTVISSGLWRDRFGSDPGVVGQTVTLDGQPYTIVGVTQSSQREPTTASDLWIPYRFPRNSPRNHGIRIVHVIGRLLPATTWGEARAEIAAISDRIAQTNPQSARDWTGTVLPLRDHIVGDVRSSLMLAFTAVGLLLLIACVNIANLLLARATSRHREIAVRRALGAARGRIARLVITESVVLAALGGIVGIGVAYLAHGVLVALEPGVIPRITEIHLDVNVLAFALGLAVFTGVLFGLAPALHGVRVDLTTVLNQGGRRGGGFGRSHHRLRSSLVTAQMALTFVLLIGAGLLVRTFLELRSVDPGFRAEGATAARMFLDARRYQGPNVSRYFGTLLEDVRALPGVTAAGASSSLPMDPDATNYDLPFRTAATAGLSAGDVPQADFRIVTPGYFEAMMVPLVAGRFFTDQDDVNAPPAILVNRTMARLHWPDQDAVGKRLHTIGWRGWTWFEIIGVVEDTRFYGLDADPRPEMYVAHEQYPFSSMTVVARTAESSGPMAAALRRSILTKDANQPAHAILPVAELIADSIASERFYAMLLGLFAMVALALAATGIYGVLSYWVNQRTQEIGIRMALGANRSEVVRHVVGNGMTVAAAGIGLGLLAAVATARMLATMLFGIGAGDPLTFAGASVMLAGAAFLACYLPARRAGRVDPMTALREE